MKTLVILPGGFHPYHAGHYELYKSAVKAFPGADVYVAATNDQKARPFPFAIKEKLAKIAGVAPGRFIQVKSPFKAQEIADHYDPDQDVMIFVRSEKDRNEQPKPGGMKKDGTPSYFQPYTGKGMQPFSKHAYFAYLPTVKFGPGITSATEIRNAWPTLNPTRKTAMVMSLYPATKQNPKLAANVVKMMDLGMGGNAITEEQSRTGNPLYWSELDDGLSVDDKMSIIEGYYTTGTLKESNSEDSTQYFTALHKFSSALVKNEKYVIAPLILVNDKIMALDKPDYMQFVGYVDDRPVFNQNDKEKIYPSNRCKELTVYQIFAFTTKKMYDKFRTALSLKFDMVLPEIDNQDMTEAYPNQQKALYKPDSTTYRGEKMPTLTDPNDIYNNRLAVNIDDQDDEPADEPNIDNSIKALIKSKLDELTPIERKVLQLRYWHDMTLADIADRIEVSAVRIRQIEAHAFRKIKKSTLDNRDADLLRQYVPESESKPIVPFSQVKQFPLTALLTGQGAGTALKADPEYRRDVRRNKHAAAAKADVDNRVKAGYSPDTDEGDWDSNE